MSHLVRRSVMAGIGLALAGAGAAMWQSQRQICGQKARTLCGHPLSKPEGALKLFHLGPWLVGRDMPAMVAQLARVGHQYNSQLVRGTSLMQHWEPSEVSNTFAEQNDPSRSRDAKQAMGSGDYGAVVLTEMVKIADAPDADTARLMRDVIRRYPETGVAP